MARRKSGTNLTPFVVLGAVGLVYFMGKTPALPQAGEPTEYWLDPTNYSLWYEAGGTVTAPQPGMRPASSWEINTYWPPVNRPEFGTPETVVY